MPDDIDRTGRDDALDELVTHLLDCGGVLSQVIASMVEFEAAGRSAPDLAPIPEVAHSLSRSVILTPTHRFEDSEVRAAAAIIEEVTNAICDQIFSVDLSANRSPGRSHSPRRRQRRRR